VPVTADSPPVPAPGLFAVIAGGGTGGHAVPAIAIAQALVERGHPAASVHFVGSARGIERRMVPAAGFSITLLPGRGIARRLTLANVGAVAGLGVAVLRAMVLIRRLSPAVVISVGGYASAPCALAAITLRRPLIVAEQNAVPGAANRLVARFARSVAVSFPGTALPRATVTGNPVRPAVARVERSDTARREARQALGLPAEGIVVAVVSGSLGSRRVNEAVVELVSRWLVNPPTGGVVAVRHVVGERDWKRLGRAVGGQGGLTDGQGRSGGAPARPGVVYQNVPFEERMDLVYAAADVLVGRAGGNTVAELAAVGLASVLVPLPGAPGDHQTGNAGRLEAVGAAVVVPDAECDAGRLEAVLRPLVANPDRLMAMGRAARTLGYPGAAAAVAALAEGACAVIERGPAHG
jgi:UDP-N-acetylglucosamine--N-acetylmuramyl-(pentapeptide) pyrophosphoryl-undecaprenol N-acetylglucosamine transferase